LNNDKRPDADNRCRLGAGGRGDWFVMTVKVVFGIDQTSELREALEWIN